MLANADQLHDLHVLPTSTFTFLSAGTPITIFYAICFHKECMQYKLIMLGDSIFKNPNDWGRANVQAIKRFALNEYVLVCMRVFPLFWNEESAPPPIYNINYFLPVGFVKCLDLLYTFSDIISKLNNLLQLHKKVTISYE